MKKIPAALLFFLFLAAPVARAQFDFSTNNGALTVTNYTGPIGSVIIPSSTNGLPVVAIGPSAFLDDNLVTNVTIPSSITNIGEYAFEACGLINITIPASVTSIGTGPFAACLALSAINVDPANPAYASIGGVLFNKNQSALVEYPGGNPAASYTIPNTVTSVGELAFYQCLSLTNLIIPASAANFGQWAFLDCTNLANLTVGGAADIGDYAFEYCTALTNINLGNSLTNLGSGVFSNCTSLAAINLTPGGPAYSSLAGVLFNQNQTELIEYPPGNPAAFYTVPNTVTNIGYDAFQNCQLAGITIPNSVLSIGDFAFLYSANLTNLTIPNSVTSLGDYSYGGCNALTNVTIGTGVTNLGVEAFAYCGALTAVYFQGNAPTADPSIFLGDYNLAAIYNTPGTTGWDATFCGYYLDDPGDYTYTITNGADTITGYFGGGSFIYPGEEFSISIPSVMELPVTTIGAGAFEGLPIASVIIPGTVTNIGSDAFADCGLTNVTIGSGAIEIGDFAFASNYLTSLVIPNGVTTIGNFAFSSGYFPTLAIPNSVASLGNGAFAGCVDLTNVTIGSGTTNIEAGAFDNCVSLAAITVAPANPAYSSLAGLLFNQNQTELVEYPEGAPATSYNVPATVTSIADDAFVDCANLAAINAASNNPAYSSLGGVLFDKNRTSLIRYPPGNILTTYTVPNGVTNIGYGAFEGCANLTGVFLPASVTSIGDDAFSSCPNLTGVNFQSNAPSADSTVFMSSGDVTVYYPSGASGWSSTFGGAPTVMVLPPPPAGSVQVTITPPGAIAAGALWRVDGNPLQPSGTTFSGLSVGLHTVIFSTTVNGWTPPVPQFVNIVSNQTTTATGTYLPFGVSGIQLSKTNLTLNGINGLSGMACCVLTSTNPALPLSQWTPIATNVLSANGNFTITITNPPSSRPQQFYLLQQQTPVWP